MTAIKKESELRVSGTVIKRGCGSPEFISALEKLVQYLERMICKGRKETTVRTYGQVIFIILRFLDRRGLHTDPGKIGEREILEILHKYPEVSSYTKKGYIGILSKWMVVMCNNDIVQKMDLLWPTSDRPGRIWADMDDVLMLINNETDPTNKLILLLAADEGMRASEIALVRLTDLKDGWIRIRGKGHGEGKMRSMPLTARVREMIREYMYYRRNIIGDKDIDRLLVTKMGNVFTGHMVTERVRRISEKNNLHITAHSIRRRFITDVLDSGVKIEVCSKMVGHENPSTTAAYYQCETKVLCEAMDTRDYYVRSKYAYAWNRVLTSYERK